MTDIVVQEDNKNKRGRDEEEKRLKRQWEGEHERGGDAESRVGVSIDQAIKIDGCLDEYQPGKASAKLSRDGLAHCKHD